MGILGDGDAAELSLYGGERFSIDTEEETNVLRASPGSDKMHFWSRLNNFQLGRV